MRLVRVLAILLIVGIAYLGQTLLDQRMVWPLLDWLRRVAPNPFSLVPSEPQKLKDLGLWMLASSGLVFGLIAPLWDGELDRVQRWRQHTPLRPKQLALLIPVLMICSVGLAVFVAYQTSLANSASMLWLGLWGVAIVIMLLAGRLLDRQENTSSTDPALSFFGQPEHSWPFFVTVLCVLAITIAFRWTDIPVRVDPMTTLAGLAGHALVTTMGTGFEEGLGVAALSYLPMALFLQFTEDGLAAVRWIGLLSALSTMTGTWLLACELFRRVPRFGPYGETIVDDGGWMAVLAAAIAGFSIVAFHFGRLPVYFEATALGVWSIFFLIRGTRTGRFILLGLAGILGGLAVYVHVIGILFLVVAIQWWVGVVLFERGGKATVAQSVASEDRRTHSQEPRPVTSTEIVYWLASVAVAGSLLAAFLLADRSAFSRFWRVEYFLVGDIASLLGPGMTETIAQLPAKLRETLLTVNLYPDASIAFGYDGPMFHFWLSPLFVLAIGVTLVNIDSLLGWLLAGWIGSGFVASSLLAPEAPYWPLLVPVLPALALATSLGMDRVRVLLVDSIGSWTVHATMYLALGAVISAALFTWIGYYQFALLDADRPSLVARAIRDRDQRQNGFLVSFDASTGQVLSEPVVAFVLADRLDSVTQIVPGAWPGGIEAGAWFLVLPEDSFVLPELMAKYPSGQMHVIRNLRGNPIFYIVDVPGAGAS